MDLNTTSYNGTMSDLIRVINGTNITLNNQIYPNSSDGPVNDLYEEYRVHERHRILVYRGISYILGVLIVLSNLSVVISSGLILKKGQKPKSTYILLGNVSLADTIVGISIIYGLSIDYNTSTLNSNPMCVFHTGILVSPAIVSIFSVGFIAVDRYIYIVHGLYYQRWCNTTRIRIGIVLIWITSVILGFLPATGWVNEELAQTRCIYVGLFPGPLILIISILSIIPIVGMAVLYTFILVKALKTVKTINNTIKIKEIPSVSEESIIRMNRRTFHTRRLSGLSESDVGNDKAIKRSASFDLGKGFRPEIKFKSKSNDDISAARTKKACIRQNNKNHSKIEFESDLSVCTIESTASIQRFSVDSNIANNGKPNQSHNARKKINKIRKFREPNKWRAIKVVMLTTASLVLTWMPFFVTVIFYVFCEEKLTNPKCIGLRALLGGPLAILAFVNSILNPLIYAWWHKGFQKTAKAYYKQYLHRYICHVIR